MTNTIHNTVDGPTPERLIAANDNFVVDKATGATRVMDAPIERLFKQGTITEDQHTAATMFFANFYNAGLAPLGAVDYERVQVDGSKPSGVSDFRMSALDRYQDSMKVLGRYASTVDAVVLREQSIEGAGRKLGHNNASQARAVGLDRLIGGLDVLARHYGVIR